MWHAFAVPASAAVLVDAFAAEAVFALVQGQRGGLARHIQRCDELGVAVGARQVQAAVRWAVVARVLDEVLPAEVL